MREPPGQAYIIVYDLFYIWGGEEGVDGDKTTLILTVLYTLKSTIAWKNGPILWNINILDAGIPLRMP